jgi:hypothetical protein
MIVFKISKHEIIFSQFNLYIYATEHTIISIIGGLANIMFLNLARNILLVTCNFRQVDNELPEFFFGGI